LRKADIAPILKARPELKGELSRVLADRLATNAQIPPTPEFGHDEEATLASRLFERIESFFRVKRD
jgi:hypothetical protein